MERVAPPSQPVFSDDDVRSQAEADGKSAGQIKALMSKRKALNSKVQAQYDKHPPSHTRPKPNDDVR